MSRDRFYDVRRFETLDSTNTYLLAEAKNGAADGTVVQANHQTQGRGRLGRTWEAPPGACLLASILMRPNLPLDDLHLCTAAVALAAVEACRTLAHVTPTLKWPNDLMVGTKKLAGILAEVLVDERVAPPSERVTVVVGLGLNITWPGPEGAVGTSLAEVGGTVVEPVALLSALLDALSTRRDALDGASGRAALAQEWRSHLATLGQQVRIELPNEAFEGEAVDLTNSGELVVQSGDGLRSVQAGDIVHLRAIS